VIGMWFIWRDASGGSAEIDSRTACTALLSAPCTYECAKKDYEVIL